MKILHVVASLQAVSGGPALSVSRLATEQTVRGHDVTVVAFDERYLGNVLPTEGVKRILVPSDLLSVRGRGWSPKFRQVLMEEGKKADVVHNHGLWMWPNAYAREAAVAAGKPLIISPRGMLEAWSLKRSKLRKAVAWQVFERKNLASAAMFHATSEQEAESIWEVTKRLRDKETKRPRWEGESRSAAKTARDASESNAGKWEGENVEKSESEVAIVVAPNGVDLPDLARRPGREILEKNFPQLKDRRWVVFMSRLHPKKGIDVLLRSWARQKKMTGDEWRVASGRTEGAESFGLLSSSSLSPVLILAGSDLIGYRKDVERMVKEFGLDESVVITGEVQGQEKDCLLANAEVFMLPSYSENFGIVIAEAMAWGRPVIASTATPWKEVTEMGAGWWVDPKEYDLLKALAEALGSSREQLGNKGTAGRKLVEHCYSWRQAADSLLAAYSGLLTNPNPRSPCH